MGGRGDFKKWGDSNNGGRMTLEWGIDNPLRTTIHVFCNSFITRAVFSTQVFQFFVEIFPFGFYLVNFECGAYLAFDHSLVNCIYPKIFMIFSLILSLIPVLKPSDSIHISVAFCFSSWIYWNSVINLPQLLNLVYPFLIHSEINVTRSKPKRHDYLNLPIEIYAVISLSAHMFVFCFYP